jgi:hypothetical protein
MLLRDVCTILPNSQYYILHRVHVHVRLVQALHIFHIYDFRHIPQSLTLHMDLPLPPLPPLPPLSPSKNCIVDHF